MIDSKWQIYRQAISIVEQGWNQLDSLLPDSLYAEKRAVREAFFGLRGALFKIEVAELKTEVDE